MQSIGEMIRDEQQNCDEQLRAIADGYEVAFMDASSTLSDAKPEIETFDARTELYEESRQDIEALRGHQRRIIGLYALTSYPFSNLHFKRNGSEVGMVMGAMKVPRDSAGFRI